MIKKSVLILFVASLLGCNSTSPEYAEPETTNPTPVVIEQTVVVLPNYYGTAAFERYHTKYSYYRYTSSGSEYENDYVGRFHFKFNQGYNNDIIANLDGKEYYLINIGKLADRYFPNDRCSVAKFSDAGSYTEIGVCQSGKTVVSNKDGYAVFF